MIYTVNMLKNCKISEYKIKKILKCFVEDSTATEASKSVKLSRNTINRFFNIFREAVLQLVVTELKIKPGAGEYIGYIQGEYGYKCNLKVYKINEKIFVFTRLLGKPDNTRYAMHDEDFNKYLGFIHQRFHKFRGFSGDGYSYQLFESLVKYNYSEQELFKLIWEQIPKTSRDPAGHKAPPPPH